MIPIRSLVLCCKGERQTHTMLMQRWLIHLLIEPTLLVNPENERIGWCFPAVEMCYSKMNVCVLC